jgi:glycosyltransferase involved in cell wall biosynthesis
MIERKKITVLVSCFACGPNWGSEIGMGWHWVKNLSNYSQLIVITESGFKKEIEEQLDTSVLKYPPVFHYIDIGDRGRHLFWKQGSYFFYSQYKRWQSSAFELAQKIISTEKIDIIHQLNLIGFREPGYLWKIDKSFPFVWGPVGGFSQVPVRYILHFDLRNIVFYLGKSFLHYLQVYFHPRVRKAFKRADISFVESSNTLEIVKRVYNIQPVLMNETGGNFNSQSEKTQFLEGGAINLLWVGRFQARKALPIAIKAIKKIHKSVLIKMSVVGDGPDENHCRMLVRKYNLQSNIKFLGKVPNAEVLRMMQSHDLLFFTSLKEGTPHVVLEALSSGLPVICHDTCGHGDVIDDSCGVKIPMGTYKESIDRFALEIRQLYGNPEKLKRLSAGAYEKVQELSWDKKAKQMYHYYSGIVS